MNEIRKESSELAKAMGLCTQCHKNKAEPHRYQCKRCIETNRRKQQKRAERNSAMEMCKSCGKRPKAENRQKCEQCLEKQRVYWRKKYKMKKARKKALGAKDEVPKRKYTRHVKITPMQMQSMVSELELFISRLSSMSAAEYLEERENLIKNILLRGGKS